jgi:hypothetical protein
MLFGIKLLVFFRGTCVFVRFAGRLMRQVKMKEVQSSNWLFPVLKGMENQIINSEAKVKYLLSSFLENFCRWFSSSTRFELFSSICSAKK